MSTPLSFDYTGNKHIDRILEAVEDAAKCFHNVNEWCEPVEWKDGLSLEQVISEVAKNAADEIAIEKE